MIAPRSIEIIIDDIIRTEGGYVDDANDSGGKTCWGITEAVARANGYKGDMRDLPKDFARTIYYKKYVVLPSFDRILLIAPVVAYELVDSGVNAGTATATEWLQKALNTLNKQGSLYPDLKIDGHAGSVTLSALAAYLRARGDEGERVLLVALNCLQGAFYMDLSQRRQKDESFVYGWLKNRVSAHV